jgi:hypothetical protein
MMSEVMRLTTFFATLSLMSLFATSVAIAAAGITNTSGVPLMCRDCTRVLTAKVKPPNPPNLHSRRAAGLISKAI